MCAVRRTVDWGVVGETDNRRTVDSRGTENRRTVNYRGTDNRTVQRRPESTDTLHFLSDTQSLFYVMLSEKNTQAQKPSVGA